MAGEIQLNSTTMATESSGTITLSNVDSAANRTNLGLGSMATETASGFIKNVQVFSTSGTYTKTTGVNDVFVMVYGGSGGGGGSNGGNGGAGGTSSFGTYCSASGGSGGVGSGGQTQTKLGAANGSGSGGNVNSTSIPGGAAGNKYQGGSTRDIGQYGGAGGFACELISGVASTVSVTVGTAGTFGNDPTYEDGLAGADGYVIVFELL